VAGLRPEAVFVVAAHGRTSGRNREKPGNRRPWCRSKPSKAKELREIAALRRSNPWCRNRPPNQCADNKNFQNWPPVVPVPSILPSLLFALPALPAEISARCKPA
jgi:hypothetical protein